MCACCSSGYHRQAVAALIRVCCDEGKLPSLLSEAVAVWSRLFPLAYRSPDSKRAKLQQLFGDAEGASSPSSVAGALLGAALRSVALAGGCSVADVLLRPDLAAPHSPRVDGSSCRDDVGVEETKGGDNDDAASQPAASAHVPTTDNSGLTLRLLNTFSVRTHSASDALRSAASIALTRLHHDLATAVLPSSKVQATVLTPVQSATRVRHTSSSVTWNYGHAPDCLAFMVR